MRRTSGYYMFWRATFFVIMGMLIFSIWYSTNKVDYVWRWYRVPQYFISNQQIDIRAEIEGEVTGLKKEGTAFVVTVKNADETESYDIPKGHVNISQGDYVYPGDVLGEYNETKPGILVQGLWTTLWISAIAIFFGILLGLFGGLARISDNPCLRWLSITYIEFIRGTPLLVQIYLWYFVFGTIINDLLQAYGMPSLGSIWYGVASLAIFAGAYVAEIVRAGIQSIHKGQMEAARSLGMTTIESMRHIILPQAFRRILPPLAGQFISLVKDSSLLGIIAIRELTKATREVVSTSLQAYELWFICALLYLILTFALSLLTQYMERRMVQS